MCQVVVINSHPVHTLVLSGTPPPPSQYPAVEILIDKDSDDNPIALTTTVYVGQPVTWYTSGTQAWSVNFATSPCALSEASPIGPKTQVYCTPQTSSGQPFAYSITVPGEKADGHGLLYVIPAPQAQ